MQSAVKIGGYSTLFTEWFNGREKIFVSLVYSFLALIVMEWINKFIKDLELQ